MSIAEEARLFRLASVESAIKSLECDHGFSSIRYRTGTNGAKMFRRQCTKCGELIGNWIPHKSIDQRRRILPIDDDLKESYAKSYRELSAELNKIKNMAKEADDRKWYEEYLKSSKWKNKRRLVLERCRFTCEGCGKARATQVHHLSYNNIGNEFLFELVGLCKHCHEALHKEHSEAG